MNYLLGMVLGYIIHDAIQPTVVGQVLDKVSLPGDLLVSTNEGQTVA
jgi:hypothetical protein